jgi:TolA-binding protein
MARTTVTQLQAQVAQLEARVALARDFYRENQQQIRQLQRELEISAYANRKLVLRANSAEKRTAVLATRNKELIAQRRQA